MYVYSNIIWGWAFTLALLIFTLSRIALSKVSFSNLLGNES